MIYEHVSLDGASDIKFTSHNIALNRNHFTLSNCDYIDKLRRKLSRRKLYEATFVHVVPILNPVS